MSEAAGAEAKTNKGVYSLRPQKTRTTVEMTSCIRLREVRLEEAGAVGVGGDLVVDGESKC
jgi:hypothetical protein